MDQRTKRRLQKLYGGGDGKLVSSFLPKGRTGQFIYAVTVKQHPTKVKIGRTRRWRDRRSAYANWDLSPGDAIVEERVFCLCEEFVDLPKLEKHILATFPFPQAYGAEWFEARVEDAARHIDRVMCEHAIAYDF